MARTFLFFNSLTPPSGKFFWFVHVYYITIRARTFLFFNSAELKQMKVFPFGLNGIMKAFPPDGVDISKKFDSGEGGT